MKRLFLGTSGYNYRDWKGIFYPNDLPQRLWLQYYSDHFDSLEVNATFYRYFKKTVFEKWKTTTNENFTFVLKGPRIITHMKKLVDVEEELERFMESAEGLDTKLAVILWQFPASFKNNENNKMKLEYFLQLLNFKTKQVFEFRDTTWFSDDLKELLEKYNAAFVINDTSAFPTSEIATSDYVYIRFHGPTSLYSSSYSTKQLEVWAEKIKNYLKKKDVYVFFNNDYGGVAIRNLNELKQLIGK